MDRRIASAKNFAMRMLWPLIPVKTKIDLIDSYRRKHSFFK